MVKSIQPEPKDNSTDKAKTSIEKQSFGKVESSKDQKKSLIVAKFLTMSKQAEDAGEKRDLLKAARNHKRGNFNAGATRMARKRGRQLYEDIEEDANHTEANMAIPHRMSWKDIRDNTDADIKKGDSVGFTRWTDRFIDAGEEVMKANPSADREKNHKRFVVARDALVNGGDADELTEFLDAANNFHANIPDIGPHKGVNNVVGERAHFNVRQTDRGRSLSPMSKRVAAMSPGRLSGIPITRDGELIDVRGETHDAEGWANLEDLNNIRKHRSVVIPSFAKPKK